MKAYPDYVEESELEREALGWCALRLDGWRLLKEVEAALEKAKPQIIAILEEEGIPVEEPTKPSTDTKS